MLETAMVVTLMVGAATEASFYYWMFRQPYLAKEREGNNDDKMRITTETVYEGRAAYQESTSRL
jgi:hypothetical protein